MTISVICANGHALKVPDQYLGKNIRCPKCQVSLMVEAPVELEMDSGSEDFSNLSNLDNDPLATPIGAPFGDPLADPLLATFGAAATYQPAAVRPVPKRAPKPHLFETKAGKASLVGGGVALGSIAALILLGIISLFRGASSGSPGSSVAIADNTVTGGPPVSASDPTLPNLNDPIVRDAVVKMSAVKRGMFNYEDKMKRFPGGSSKVSGLSWRVHILPFIDQQELFDQFKLDEPWDSPSNLPLAEKMPDAYRLGNTKGSRTQFQVVRGDDLVFGRDKPQGFNIFTDGIEKTTLVVVVGADKAVTWTQPNDFAFDRSNPVQSLGKLDGNVIVMTIGDKVHGVGTQIAPQDFLALVTPAGGEIADPTDLMEKTLQVTPTEFVAGRTRQQAAPLGAKAPPGSGDLSAPTSLGNAKMPLPTQVQIGAYGLLAHEKYFNAYVPMGSKRPGGGLSWRVHILPFVGEAALYRQFKLDEAWDGPTNSKLLKSIPNCYNTGDGGKTRIRGQASLIGPAGVRYAGGISDSPTATLLTLGVPAVLATEWTKPEDLDMNAKTIGNLLSATKQDVVFGVTCVGQPVKFLPKVAEEHLLSMLTINGGEKVDIDNLIATAQLAVPNDGQVTGAIFSPIALMTERTDRMKKVVLAMHNYESTYKSYPPAKQALPSDGKELLSWRVHILPFLEEKVLYDKFKLDEAWDSPNNLALLDKMPSVFKDPVAGANGKTTIIKVAGFGTAYEKAEGPKHSAISDGGLTVLLYKTSDENQIEWTKPDTLQVDLKNPKVALGNQAGEYFHCAMLDGRVSTIKMSLPDEQFKAIFSAKGMEMIPSWMNDYGGQW